MARTSKKLSLEEQLANLTNEIDEMENTLKKMKETKKELENQIKTSKMLELDELITSKGLSYEEVKELLNKE